MLMLDLVMMMVHHVSLFLFAVTGGTGHADVRLGDDDDSVCQSLFQHHDVGAPPCSHLPSLRRCHKSLHPHNIQGLLCVACFPCLHHLMLGSIIGYLCDWHSHIVLCWAVLSGICMIVAYVHHIE